MGDTNRMTAPFYDGIVEACLRIVGMDGKHPAVSMTETSYVLAGRTCWIKTDSDEYAFWVGINGPRLFFIAYIKDIDVPRARDVFAFSFGGADVVAAVDYLASAPFVTGTLMTVDGGRSAVL